MRARVCACVCVRARAHARSSAHECMCLLLCTIGIVWLGSVNLHHHHYDTDRVLCVAGERRDDDLSLAVADSHRIYSLRLLAARLHNKRLDSLLEYNGLKRVPVVADGSCCFSAASLHLIGHNHKSLREALCVHIENNVDLYTSFVRAVGDSERDALRPSQKHSNFEKMGRGTQTSTTSFHWPLQIWPTGEWRYSPAEWIHRIWM